MHARAHTHKHKPHTSFSSSFYLLLSYIIVIFYFSLSVCLSLSLSLSHIHRNKDILSSHTSIFLSTIFKWSLFFFSSQYLSLFLSYCVFICFDILLLLTLFLSFFLSFSLSLSLSLSLPLSLSIYLSLCVFIYLTFSQVCIREFTGSSFFHFTSFFWCFQNFVLYGRNLIPFHNFFILTPPLSLSLSLSLPPSPPSLFVYLSFSPALRQFEKSDWHISQQNVKDFLRKSNLHRNKRSVINYVK